MNLKKLVLSIIICELAGIIGSVFTFSAITTWYAFLNKPWFSPPNNVFGPVWTVLYLLMGISLYLALEKGLTEKARNFFGLQLGLNALWSILFFGLRSPLLGLIEIIVLWLAIVFTIKEFYSIEKKSAYLLVPYLLWVSFATLLNFSIWIIN